MKQDMVEQEIFIQKTILLGKPALATAVQLHKEYNFLEENTRKEMNFRIKDLLAHREKISTNNQKVRALVRRDVGLPCSLSNSVDYFVKITFIGRL